MSDDQAENRRRHAYPPPLDPGVLRAALIIAGAVLLIVLGVTGELLGWF
jgi:hypothetical protein